MGGSLLQDSFLIRFTQKTQFARYLLPNRVCIWYKVFAYSKWQNLFLWSLSFIHRIQMPLLTVSQATNCSGLECWPILHILLYLGHVLKAPEGDLCGETKNISRRHMVPQLGVNSWIGLLLTVTDNVSTTRAVVIFEMNVISWWN